MEPHAPSFPLPTNTSPLTSLIHTLNSLGPELTEEHLAALLRIEAPELTHLAPWIHFTPEARCRTLITRNPYYEIIVIGWLPGQASSLHEHGPSHCVFRVMQGVAEELRHHSLLHSTPYCRLNLGYGSVAEVIPGEAHIVRNPSAHESLVTLHIYAPPLADAPPSRLLSTTATPS